MNGWDTMLIVTLRVGLELLLEAGCSEALGLKEQLTSRAAKAYQAACISALDRAVQDAGHENVRLLLQHRPFRDAVLVGLLDPIQGFDLRPAAQVWGDRLLAQARVLRRFFVTLENALLTDDTCGPLLEGFYSLRFRHNVLDELQRLHLDVATQDLIAAVDTELTADNTIEKISDVTRARGEELIGEDVLKYIVKSTMQRLAKERGEVTVYVSMIGHPRTEPLHLGYKYVLQAGVSREPIDGFSSMPILLPPHEVEVELNVAVHVANRDVVVDPEGPEQLVLKKELLLRL